MVIQSKSDQVAARLFLESLGPNNELNNAIDALSLLLNAENAIVLASVNRRTSDISKDVKESLATTKHLEEQTFELRQTLNTEIRKENERHGAFVRSQRELSSHLTVTMDRVESLSGASHASIEEVRELILSIIEGFYHVR